MRYVYHEYRLGKESDREVARSDFKATQIPLHRVVFQLGRVHGSCGAPYFTKKGKAFAFYFTSVNELGRNVDER
jgi:hypothetical protein